MGGGRGGSCVGGEHYGVEGCLAGLVQGRIAKRANMDCIKGGRLSFLFGDAIFTEVFICARLPPATQELACGLEDPLRSVHFTRVCIWVHLMHLISSRPLSKDPCPVKLPPPLLERVHPRIMTSMPAALLLDHIRL